MEIINALIKSAEIEIEDHGLLTISMMLDYGDGTVQGFGNYQLYNPQFNTDVGGFFVWKIFQVLEVNKWSNVKGKPIRVTRDANENIISIGHFTKDIWFTPRTELVERQKKIEVGE